MKRAQSCKRLPRALLLTIFVRSVYLGTWEGLKMMKRMTQMYTCAGMMVLPPGCSGSQLPTSITIPADVQVTLVLVSERKNLPDLAQNGLLEAW